VTINQGRQEKARGDAVYSDLELRAFDLVALSVIEGPNGKGMSHMNPLIDVSSGSEQCLQNRAILMAERGRIRRGLLTQIDPLCPSVRVPEVKITSRMI